MLRLRASGARRAWLGSTALLLGLTVIPACSSAGKFVWYYDLQRTEWGQPPAEYVIGVGDAISIKVYDQEPLSLTAKIRRDGRIALPFVGEVVVAGKHPAALARELETRLKAFIVSPRVTVNVDASQPVTVTLVGEVGHVGVLTLDPSAAGLLQAIAQAGGPSQFADESRIFVLRQFPEFHRIRFTYDALVHNEGGAATFPLQTGDVIVVE